MTQNSVVLTGRIAFAPKTFDTKSGGKIATFVLNVWVGKDKDGKSQYIGINVKTFDSKYAEAVAALGQGADIAIVGRLTVDSFEKDGKKQYTTSVIADYVGVDA